MSHRNLAQIPLPLVNACEAILDCPITNCSVISGGDINEARLLSTTKGFIFLKFNTAAFAQKMFEVEAKGLKLLAATQCLKIPQVICSGKIHQYGFLLLEYISSGNTTSDFWQDFGKSLAALHQHSAPLFGLDHDNYIGRLAQYNNQHPSWDEFYILERLEPQVEMASAAQLLDSTHIMLFEKLYKKIKDICPVEKPALIHGDLWSGNFMIDKNVSAVLIDPAICYAHREMDLAMSLLFGGFSKEFYSSYQAAFPLAKDFEERVAIYQLYYLLVHLNLFGSSYKHPVMKIVKRFV